MSRYVRPAWRRIADLLFVVLLVAGIILFLQRSGSEPIYTSVKVLDGDSLRDGTDEIRLHGIDAPEYRQNCTDAAGRDYRCGRDAARHLRKLIGNSAVTCNVVDTDRYGRTVGVCRAGETELNLAMVEAGWALAYTRHSLAYVRAEGRAERARLGIWQGKFERPEDWRNAHRADLTSESAAVD